jgi:hypothetical protein
LTDANLVGADLTGANLMHARLDGANLSLAVFGQTIFGGVTLSKVKGLESSRHLGPSLVDHWTLARGRELPVNFLRGCGLPESWVTPGENDSSVSAAPAVWPGLDGLQLNPCFIAYVREDAEFAERLQAALQGRGVRCWFALNDSKTNGRFRGVAQDRRGPGDQTLLVLSAASLRSSSVEQDARRLLQKQSESKRPLLCLGLLVDLAAPPAKRWLADLRARPALVDFRNWPEPSGWQTGLDQLTAWINGAE